MATNNKCIPMGQLAELGLASLSLYHTASFSSSSHLAEYILALAAYHQRNSPSMFLSDSLKSLYQTHSGWSGNDVVQVVQMVLKIVAAIPGGTQKERIDTIMHSTERVNPRKDIGCGLLIVAKDLAMSRSSQTYSTEYSQESMLLDVYVETITELRNLQAVEKWMTENKLHWSWLEQWLRPDAGNSTDRGDSRRDGAIRHGQSGFDQQHSDSDINGGLNESDEEDDDDSRFEGISSYNSVSSGVIQVHGAGLTQVNGIYTRTGSWDGVDLYTKSGIWDDKEEVFSLFRCRLSDNSKRWYISIIPRNNNPGTSKDVDFYMATANSDAREIPHNYSWTSARGTDGNPAPSVIWKQEIGISDNEDPVGEGIDDLEQ
jgi:ubiquitin carboxyl-terminal hydrolase 9/24